MNQKGENPKWYSKEFWRGWLSDPIEEDDYFGVHIRRTYQDIMRFGMNEDDALNSDTITICLNGEIVCTAFVKKVDHSNLKLEVSSKLKEIAECMVVPSKEVKQPKEVLNIISRG